MAQAGIVGLGAYVPPTVMTNDDWAELVDTSDDWITAKTGIKERRIASDGVCTSDLAAIASLQAITEAGIEPGDVDLIILATSTPDVPIPATAAILQDKLGCIGASAFDLNAVCSSWVQALDIGDRYVGTEGYENVLVVGADAYSRIINWEDRTTCVLFGDGAGAAVLRAVDAGSGILGSWMQSDGGRAGVIEIRAGGVRTPILSDTFNEGDQYFQMDGRAVWDFAIEAFPNAVRGVLERVGKSLDDVDLIIPHQANLRILEAGMENLGLGMNKTFTNLHKYGNTAAASVPIALREAVDRGRVGRGDLLVTVAFGGGVTWGANAMIW
jgi:3-oxoacyl-[acyl-carrier-protein] synthase-3